MNWSSYAPARVLPSSSVVAAAGDNDIDDLNPSISTSTTATTVVTVENNDSEEERRARRCDQRHQQQHHQQQQQQHQEFDFFHDSIMEGSTSSSSLYDGNWSGNLDPSVVLGDCRREEATRTTGDNNGFGVLQAEDDCFETGAIDRQRVHHTAGGDFVAQDGSSRSFSSIRTDGGDLLLQVDDPTVIVSPSPSTPIEVVPPHNNTTPPDSSSEGSWHHHHYQHRQQRNLSTATAPIPTLPSSSASSLSRTSSYGTTTTATAAPAALLETRPLNAAVSAAPSTAANPAAVVVVDGGDDDDDISGIPTVRGRLQPPQPHLADSLIAQQLSGLSMREREQVYYDVHGVRDEVDETQPLLVEAAIHRLVHKELPRLQQKHSAYAYTLAVAQDKTYVHRQEFLLKFLRAELFDPAAAALRMVRHFETKLDLFGPDALSRDITQDDDLTDPDDVATLYGGQAQILPFRDRAGRNVTFWTAIPPAFGAWGPTKSKLRRQFYFCQIMSEDIETQKKGIVAVYVCNTNGDRDGSRASNSTYAWKAAMIARSQPIRCEAVHLTMEEISAWGPLFDTVKIALSPFLRVRIKTHFGSYSECMYALQTFGIPAHEFPVLPVHWTAEEAGEGGEGGTRLVVQTEQHVEMMTKRRERERREKAYRRAQQVAEAASKFWEQHQHQDTAIRSSEDSDRLEDDDDHDDDDDPLLAMDDLLMPLPIDESLVMQLNVNENMESMDSSMSSLKRPTTPYPAVAMVSAGSQNEKTIKDMTGIPPPSPYHLVTPPTPRGVARLSSSDQNVISGATVKAGVRKGIKAAPVVNSKPAFSSSMLPSSHSPSSALVSPRNTKPQLKRDVPSSHGKRVGVPSRNDVLFGRGKGFQNHIGNQKYRQMIEDCQETYELANKEQKTRIAEEIIDIIILQGKGRFLKDMDGSGWRIVSDPVALRQKVAHAFRGLRDKRDKERQVAVNCGEEKPQRRSKTSKQPSRTAAPAAVQVTSKQRSRHESDVSSSDDDDQGYYMHAILSSPEGASKRSKRSAS